MIAESTVQMLVREYAAAHDAARALLAEADKLRDQLSKAIVAGDIRVGDSVILEDGRRVYIVDNFQAKNTVWRPAPVHRYDISTKATG